MTGLVLLMEMYVLVQNSGIQVSVAEVFVIFLLWVMMDLITPKGI